MNKKKVLDKRIPTILGLLLIALALGGGIYLIFKPEYFTKLTALLPLPKLQLPRQLPTETAASLTIDNPKLDNEELNTQKPEFLGRGPAGKVLTIKIEEAYTYTSSTTIGEDGAWRFTPPVDLEPGNYTLSISFQNDQGQPETLTRKFIVLAAGESDLPALTATPSASLQPSSTPSASLLTSPSPNLSPSPSLEGRTTIPTTEQGMPPTGTLLPTLILSLGGICLLVLGILL